jgi:hypothetical protein
MLSNAYFLAKIGADTAENEQHSAEILPIGRCVADRSGGRHRISPSSPKTLDLKHFNFLPSIRRRRR